MSWSPNDLVADADLQAYERNILDDFGPSTFAEKRQKALEDWLFPILKGRGFDPFRLRTRAEASKAWGYTAAAYTDKTSDASDTDADDLDLAAVFATAANDRLYIGSTQPFRGLFVRMLDTVGTAASALTVKYFNGDWLPLVVNDATSRTSGKTLSGSGSVIWDLPMDWVTRKVNGFDALYWVELSVSATPTSATAGQIGVIRASSLRAPLTFRTLQLIFREAPTSQEGPWSEKAEFYAEEAESALQRALPIVGGEFDTDETDLISPTEAAQTSAEAGGGDYSLERA